MRWSERTFSENNEIWTIFEYFDKYLQFSKSFWIWKENLFHFTKITTQCEIRKYWEMVLGFDISKILICDFEKFLNF